MREIRIVNDTLEEVVVVADWVDVGAASVEQCVSISIHNVVALRFLNIDERICLNWVLENTKVISQVLLVSQSGVANRSRGSFLDRPILLSVVGNDWP